jgi:hypothetical protein
MASFKRKKKSKGYPSSLKETQALIESLPKGNRAVPVPDGTVLLNLDNSVLDFAAQPRARSCGVCGSSDVRAYTAMLDPRTLGQNADEPTAMAALIVGICGTCEDLGPEVFGPAVMRRLATESFDRAEELAAAELERRGLRFERDEAGRIRNVNGKRTEVALVGPGEVGVFRDGDVRPDTEVVIFTDCQGKWWIATAGEVRS